MNIAVILEAAGNSTRFGSNKLLHIMEDGRPMVCAALDAAREAIMRLEAAGAVITLKPVLVTQYPEVADLAPDFEVTMNHHPELGISLSMQLGIEAAGDVDAYMFCVCDQPWIKSSTIIKLINAFVSSGIGIVSLSWNGKMCNPKIFAAKYRDELLSVSGDTGGRQIIKDHKDDLLLAEADSESETVDIDYL